MDKVYICKKCNEPLTEDDFYANRTQGKSYRKTTCKKCDIKARKTRRSQWRAHTEQQKERIREGGRKYKRDPKNRARLVVAASKRSDAQSGRENRMEIEWVKERLNAACSYCGETEMKMTLDRIDSAIGHIPENILPACMRCNYMKRDMPFAAWKVLIPSIRKAREKGLFADWDGFSSKRKVLGK